ncbi:MAG: RIP metalloprotease RseP, partial [Kiritimatiellales bacterium]|nr:RIP metalloprotease RseP [Kiritimatiellales bacterium]
GMEKMQGDNANDRQALPDVSPWKKIAVALAGPLCNIILALVIAIIVYFAPEDGITDENGVYIAQVEETSGAYAAGLRAGDEIKAINGNPVKSWYETRVECLLGANDDEQVDLTVQNAVDGERTVRVSVNAPENSNDLIVGVFQAVPCLINQIVPGSPAEQAGLMADDIIYSIDNTMVIGTAHFIEIVQKNPDKEIPLIIRRNDKTITLPITPKYDSEHDQVMIGIHFGGTMSMPWTLSGTPIEQVKTDASSIFRLLKALTTKGEAKKAAGGLGGPVAIFTMIWFALKMGIFNALGLIRFININLAVLNLLPLPVLDGGHIVFSLWEGITRRKVHPKVVGTLVNIFAVLLIGAMIMLSWRDADRNWNISRIFNVFKKAPVEQVATPAGTDSESGDAGNP